MIFLKYRNFFSSFTLFIILLLPVLALGAGLVPCDGTPSSPCDYNALMTMINNVIDYVFKFLVLPIAAIMFAYAGILYLVSGAVPSTRSKAKSIFTDVLFGLVIATASWLVIKLILDIVGFKNGEPFGF